MLDQDSQLPRTWNRYEGWLGWEMSLALDRVPVSSLVGVGSLVGFRELIGVGIDGQLKWPIRSRSGLRDFVEKLEHETGGSWGIIKPHVFHAEEGSRFYNHTYPRLFAKFFNSNY